MSCSADVDRELRLDQDGHRAHLAVTRWWRPSSARSPFLSGLAIPDRVRVVPAGIPAGPIGAALATRGDTLPGHGRPEGVPQVRFDGAVELGVSSDRSAPPVAVRQVEEVP